MPRRPGFDRRLVNVRFAVDKNVTGIVFFFEYFCFFFFLSVSLQQCLILILYYMFNLPEGLADGRTDEGWEPSKKESFFGNRGALNTKHLTFREYLCSVGGPGSSVGIVTDYGLDGPGSNPGGDERFRPSRPALGPTQLPVQWVPCLYRG